MCCGEAALWFGRRMTFAAKPIVGTPRRIVAAQRRIVAAQRRTVAVSGGASLRLRPSDFRLFLQNDGFWRSAEIGVRRRRCALPAPSKIEPYLRTVAINLLGDLDLGAQYFLTTLNQHPDGSRAFHNERTFVDKVLVRFALGSVDHCYQLAVAFRRINQMLAI